MNPHPPTVQPIRTKRLLLRPLTADDAPALVLLTNDVSIARMMATIPHPFEFADALALISEYMNLARQGTGAGLAIVKPGRDAFLLGVISYSFMAPRADMGFWLGAKHRGRGYAEEAVRAVIEIVMSRGDIGYITAGAYHDNLESIGLQTKIGFIRTGVSRRLNRFRGTATDHIDMVYSRPR